MVLPWSFCFYCMPALRSAWQNVSNTLKKGSAMADLTEVDYIWKNGEIVP